jgi:hypothetical protein
MLYDLPRCPNLSWWVMTATAAILPQDRSKVDCKEDNHGDRAR